MTRLARIGVVVLTVLGILAVITVIVLPLFLSGFLKRNLVTILHERFQSDVEIKGLHVIAFPHVYASVEGVTLRQNGRTDVPPLFIIKKLTVSASILGLLRSPRHVSSIHLEGLQIHIPPKDENAPKHAPRKFSASVVVDQIISDDALLETLPSDPKKVPRDFEIHSLVMDSFGFDRAASYHAILTNAVPVGQIDSEGQFGPWQGDVPGDTPVSGSYLFSNADFSTLKGLAGLMSSTGKYSGSLDHLDVAGDTSMSNFALSIVGNPIPLSTHYVAVVDGINGDTYLTSVEARLGNSTISTSGDVIGIPGKKGRQINLVAASKDARMEDFLRLVVKGDKPLMEGAVGLHSKIMIAAGEGDLLNRLSLDGQFDVADAHFMDANTQNKLDSLSRRGQGEPKDEDIQDVISRLRGRFILRDATITLSRLSFHVPGASVQLDGSYNLQSEELDFRGHLLLEAKLSQTVSGKKSLLLKFVDPFFKNKNGGGSSIPIKITGNRSHPSFGLDLHDKSARASVTEVR